MYLIPAADGSNMKFPVVTTLLIALNCLVFFGLQTRENEGYADALAFSKTSGLLAIEGRVYDDFLKARQKTLPPQLQEERGSDAFFKHMMGDDRFQYELNQHILIPETDPQFGHWLELRQIFEADLDRVFSRNYGYAPARKNYGALITTSFLHRSFMHLLVNMILLWFVGGLVECGVGRIWFLGGYLGSGLGGCLLFGLIFPLAQSPLLGSSGAIAGLMGMACLLFGQTRLQLVHSFGFSFDYGPFPGWILIPFWLVSEVGLLSTGVGPDSASVAPLGGLLVGLGLGLKSLGGRAGGGAPVGAREKAPGKAAVLLEKVEWELALQKRGEARQAVLQLLELEPDNRQGLTHLFNIDKCTPNAPEFHATASLFLAHLAKTRESAALCSYFEEYSQLSAAPKVHPDLLCEVATSYTRAGKTEKASRILALLVTQDPENAGLPSCLFNLAQMYRAGNKQVEAKQCLRILCARYPETNSGKKAMEICSPKLGHTFNTVAPGR